MSNRLPIGLVLVLLVASCTPGETRPETSSDSTSLLSAGTAATIPSTTTLAPPEEAHIVDGEWLLTYVLESVSEDFTSPLDRGDKEVAIVTFDPTCDVGPCDLEAEISRPYLERVKPSSYRVVWADGSYTIVDETPALGSCTDRDGESIEDGLDLRTVLQLTPSEYEAVESAWRVTSLVGTRTLEWSPNQEAASRGCGSFEEEYSAVATPFEPDLFTIPTSPALPPGSLLFVQETDRGDQLHAAGIDSEPRPLGLVSGPYVVSPDGASVVHGGGSGLSVMSTDGRAETEFFTNGRVSSMSELAWSSDGGRIALVRDSPGGGADVWYVAVPYGVPTRVTSGGYALGGVSWGPTDDTLLFDWGRYEEVDGSFQAASTIFSYDLSTEEVTEVVPGGFRPRIGSNGEKLTYLVPESDATGRPSRWAIVVSRPDGSGARTVLTAALGPCPAGSVLPCSAVISPDGSEVAFSDNDDCVDCPIDAFHSRGVWTIDLDSGETSLVSESGWQAQWVER